MIHGCTVAGYESAEIAAQARKHIKRVYRAQTTCALCERCDLYHVTVKIGQYPVLTRWKTIIELIAQGLGRQAIAKELGVTPYAADHQITHILNHFYATNRAHLVAIAVSLGIVSPNSFVPNVGDRKEHACEPRADL